MTLTNLTKAITERGGRIIETNEHSTVFDFHNLYIKYDMHQPHLFFTIDKADHHLHGWDYYYMQDFNKISSIKYL